MGTAVRPQADPFADLASHDPFGDLAVHHASRDINLGTDEPRKPLLRPLTPTEAKAAPPVPAQPSKGAAVPPFARTVADQTSPAAQGLVQGAHTFHDQTTVGGVLSGMAEDILTHPDQAILQTAIPNVPGIVHSVKDVGQYLGQKAAELSLPATERAAAEADPNRIPGARAGVEAAMLAAPALIHGGVETYHNIRGAIEAPGPWESTPAGGLPSAEGLAHSRADAIAARPLPSDPFADLAPTGEESPSGVKFTDKRAVSAMPSGLITPEDANARPSTLVAPGQAPAGPILKPGETPPLPPEPLLDRFGVPIKGEPGQLATGEYGPSGIRRIPASELPINQRPPVEPGPDAQTVSAGGRILRRPGGTIEPPPQLEPTASPESPQLIAGLESPPVEPSPAATTYSTPEPLLKPLVSSNGTFEARPGVLKDVNAALDASPTPARPFTATFGPEDVGESAPSPELPGEPRNVPADELINKTTLDTDPNGSKALDAELERLKSQGLDKQTVSFEAQRRAAQDFADNLNIDRLTLDPSKYGRMSGAEIVGLKNVLTQNLNMMGELSKQMADESLSTGETELLSDRLDKLRDQNDALLSKIVKESSEKGRDLGFLRQLSNGTLDPDAWIVTAKRLAGDSILSDEKIATIRRLAQEAADACGGA